MSGIGTVCRYICSEALRVLIRKRNFLRVPIRTDLHSELKLQPRLMAGLVDGNMMKSWGIMTIYFNRLPSLDKLISWNAKILEMKLQEFSARLIVFELLKALVCLHSRIFQKFFKHEISWISRAIKWFYSRTFWMVLRWSSYIFLW